MVAATEASSSDSVSWRGTSSWRGIASGCARGDLMLSVGLAPGSPVVLLVVTMFRPVRRSTGEEVESPGEEVDR